MHWTVWERVLSLLTAKTLDITPVIGGTWPLNEWHSAFESMHSGTIAKSILLP